MTGEFRGTINLGGGPQAAVASGTNYTDMFVAGYDHLGNFLWSRTGGGASDDKGLAVAANGSRVFVSGSFHSIANFSGQVISSNGQADHYVVTYDASSGAFAWIEAHGGTYAEIGPAIAAGPGRSVVAVGTYLRSTSFGAQWPLPTTSGNPLSHMFIVSMRP